MWRRPTMQHYCNVLQSRVHYSCTATTGESDIYIYILYIYANSSASIPLVLIQYEHFSGLALSWMSFGSSGHIRRPPGGVIANYHLCKPY